MWGFIFFMLSITAFGELNDKENCMVPIMQMAPWPSSCHILGQQRIADLPERVLNWGSGGRGGTPWRFNEPACNEFFVDALRRISEARPGIKLSTHDLFHAHLIDYGRHAPGLGLVFHAKEYPSDLEVIKNYYQPHEDRFLSTDPDFIERNFVYFSQATEFAEKNTLYVVQNKEACHELFEPGAVSYLAENRLAAKLPRGQVVGDVNVFMPASLNNIKYRFYDQEEQLTGKSPQQRQQANLVMDEWLGRVDNQALVYFMTGLGH